MALQIRLVHALADQVLELPARSVEQPVVVGRSDKAEVHVPSANVAVRHCLLFVHGGQWILQDAGSSGGTLLNGTPLTAPARLKSGDVITLAGEANPAVLVVDPNNLGMPFEGAAPATPVAAPATPMAAPASPLVPAPPQVSRPRFPTSPEPAESAPGAYAAPDYVAPAPVDVAAAAEYSSAGYASEPADPAHPDETLEAPSIFAEAAPSAADLVSATAVARKMRSRQKTLSPAAVVLTAVAALIIIIVGIAMVRSKLAANEAEEARAREKAPAAAPVPMDEGPSHGRKSAFTSGFPTQKPAPVAPSPAVGPAVAMPTGTPAATPPPATTPANEAEDPRRQTPGWLNVEDARLDPDPVHALVVYDDYLKENPDTPFKADLAKYNDEALDRLWLNRVVQLCKERAQARSDVDSLSSQIAQETNAEFKKTLLANKTDAQNKLNEVNDELKSDFNYTGADVPTITDPAVKQSLETAHNASAYEKWKKIVLKRIINSHGTKLPWS